MQTGEALTALTALAHPTRLDAYRMLIRAEPGGLSTGQMVEATGLGQSTFSSQLAILVAAGLVVPEKRGRQRSEEHTSELQSLMRISYAVFCLKKKKQTKKKDKLYYK